MHDPQDEARRLTDSMRRGAELATAEAVEQRGRNALLRARHERLRRRLAQKFPGRFGRNR